jgi:hypothetical protein
MNCLAKKRDKEADAADLAATRRDKEEVEELTILLEGRYVAEDYFS